MPTQTIYCVDTSALTRLKFQYSPKNLPSLWRALEGLIEEGRFLCPRQVLRELEKVQDELLVWAKAHEQMFIPLDEEQDALAREILTIYPRLVDIEKQIPDADPFVLALAVCRMRAGNEVKVITQEVPADMKQFNVKPKLPNACSGYGVSYGGVWKIWEDEDWSI